MAEQFITSPFDPLRHLDGEREFWLARELYRVLGYNRWENFEKVIAKSGDILFLNGERLFYDNS